MADLPIPGSKRRRLRGSCDICKQRKSDSAQMPGNKCSNCIAFNSECTHATARLPPKTPPRTTDDNGKAKAHVAAIVVQATSHIKDADVRGVLLDVARYARSLENQLASQRRSPSLPSSLDLTATPSPPPLIKEEEDDQLVNGILTERFERFSLGYEQDRYYGKSSHFDLISTAMDLKSLVESPSPPRGLQPSTKRLPFWRSPWEYEYLEREEVHPPLLFPPQDLLRSLIDIYFTKVNFLVLLLHRPSFERSLASGLHLVDRQFGSVVLGVCALASKFSDDPRVIMEGTNSQLSAGWKYFCQLQPWRQSFLKSFSLYEAQVICLYTFYVQGSSAPDACWGLGGSGIRYAQEVGVHRRNRFSSKVLNESWKRVFWALICIDTLSSSFCGRPRATTSDDYDLDYPVECDDEYWENPDPLLAFKQPPGKPAGAAFLVAFLKLVEILGMAQKTIYTNQKNRSPEWIRDAVTNIDSALNAWSDMIPEHLRWDPHMVDPLFATQSAMLYATYYHVQIQVHRIFIVPPSVACNGPDECEPGPNYNYPSLAICASAARACIHVVDTASQRGFFCDPHILNSVFDAGIILLLNVWGGRHVGVVVDPRKCLQDVDLCLRIFRAYETRWQMAGRQHDIITELMNAANMNVPYAPNPLKRTRDHADPDSDLQGLDSEWLGEQSLSSGSSSGLDIEASFALPMYTEDLGRLPVYQPLTFTYPPAWESDPIVDTAASVSTLASSNDFGAVRMPDSLAPLLTGAPTGYDWDDWGKYITSVEELMQSLDRPDVTAVVN
ncbi:fungal-specific transcription factor domain-containing protein [Mycena filopes]|nr:fungal-specific transcription factor domain-containing protein [Mycena filopes]